MNIKRFAVSLLGSLLIFFNCLGISAFAETSLPPGAVKGLPERLAALDDEGNAVNSETGEYFFRVEEMEYGETYTKNVQLMNLREDTGYHIFFYVEPLFKTGDIDLERGCICRFFLDGKQFYEGNVNGKGNIDLTEQHFDCGHYDPGETHTLRCEIIWNDLTVLRNVDNGRRLVDKDGVHVLVGPSGSGYVEGEIEFKWIFYAKLEQEGSGTGSGGSDTGGTPVDDSSPDNSGGSSDGGNDSNSGSDSDSNSGSDDSGSTPGSGDENSGSGTEAGTDSGDDSTDGFFPPYTGFLMKDGTFWLAGMGIIAAMIVVLLVLIKKQNKDRKK